MNHTLRIQTIDTIQQAVGTWSAMQFKHQEPELGIMEEIGEGLAHPILKRSQGIRGFDNEEKFREVIEDGIADVGIYLLNLCHERSVRLGVPVDIIKDDRQSIERLAKYASDLMAMRRTGDWTGVGTTCHLLWCALHSVASFHGFDVVECIQKVWNKIVKKRNWQADPVNAAKIVAEDNESELAAKAAGAVGVLP